MALDFPRYAEYNACEVCQSESEIDPMPTFHKIKLQKYCESLKLHDGNIGKLLGW